MPSYPAMASVAMSYKRKSCRRMRSLAAAIVVVSLALPRGCAARISSDQRRGLDWKPTSNWQQQESKNSEQGSWQRTNQQDRADANTEEGKWKSSQRDKDWKATGENKWEKEDSATDTKKWSNPDIEQTQKNKTDESLGGNQWSGRQSNSEVDLMEAQGKEENENKWGESDKTNQTMGEKEYQWGKGLSNKGKDGDEAQEASGVDAFLLSNTTEWHDIPYDDDTVSGWLQMEAATATPSPAPTSAWKSDEPSSLPTRLPASSAPTSRPTDLPSPNPTQGPTASLTTGSPTWIPTETPTSNRGGFLSTSDNNVWSGNQPADNSGNQGFSINNFQPQSQGQFINVGPPPTTPAPTNAPVPPPTTNSFFGFLPPQAHHEQGISQGTSTSAPATESPVVVGWSPTTTSAPIEDLSENSTNFLGMATAEPDSQFGEQGMTSTDMPGQVPEGITYGQPGFVDAGYFPTTSSPTENGADHSDVPNGITRLFQSPETQSGLPEQDMNEGVSANETNASLHFQAEGNESITAGESEVNQGFPTDIPDWDPWSSGSASTGSKYSSSKGSKGQKGSRKNGKGRKGGKRDKGKESYGSGSRKGSSSSYKAALKCIEDKKAAKKHGKGDIWKKCPDVRSIKDGSREKIVMPHPGHNNAPFAFPGYPHYPSPTFIQPPSISPPQSQAPVVNGLPITSTPSVSRPTATTLPSVAPNGVVSPPISAPSAVTPVPVASPVANESPPIAAPTEVSQVPVAAPAAVGSPSSLIPPNTSPPSATPITTVDSQIPTSSATPQPVLVSIAPVTSAPTLSPGLVPTATDLVESSPPITSFPTSLNTVNPLTPFVGSDATAVPTALLVAAPTPAIERTSAPSQPASISQVSETWVYARGLTVTATGSIDLSSVQQEFFNQTVAVMRPFFQAYFGDSLESFQLGLSFLESDTDPISAENSGSEAKVISYFVAEVGFHISSAEMDVLIDFDRRKATELVEMFYEGDPRDILLKLMDSRGIPIDSLQILEEQLASERESSTLPPTFTPTKEPEFSSEGEPQDSETKSTNAALYAGVVSGGVILVAIGVVIYATRKNDRNFFKDALESVSDSLYNDSISGPYGGKALPVLSPNANATATTSKSSTASHDTRSRIKPAAITLRGRKSTKKSSDSVSTLGSSKFNIDGRTPPINEDRAEVYDHLQRMENGPDLVASRVLTYQDADIQGLATNYPEFDIYHQSNPYADTAWSVDGLTLEDEGDSILERPRRWQDESSEAGISGLPDHHSSSNGSIRS